MKKLHYGWVLVILSLLFPVFAFSQSGDIPSDPKLHSVGDVLLTILVLSIIFEAAMTPIFNWRLFLKYAEGKGMKTPIVIGTAFLVFWSYDLDIIHNLLLALGQKAESGFGGQVLTSLLIAGGSDGVFRIFTKLGIRNPAERKKKAEESRVAAPTSPQAGSAE